IMKCARARAKCRVQVCSRRHTSYVHTVLITHVTIDTVENGLESGPVVLDWQDSAASVILGAQELAQGDASATAKLCRALMPAMPSDVRYPQQQSQKPIITLPAKRSGSSEYPKRGRFYFDYDYN